MMDLINALLGFNAAIINRGRVVWMRVVVRSIIVVLVLLLIGTLANYGGWKGLAMFFAFATGVVGIALSLRPEGWVYATELGILSGIASVPETVRQEVRSFLELYAQTAAKLLFWISGMFFILGTISIKENPWAVLGILAAAIVIFSYVVGYTPKMVIARRVVYAYACFMLFMLFFSLIPRHQWVRWTGHDVKGFFASTPTEVGVSEAKEKAEEERQAKNARVLKVINEKIARGGGKALNEILSPEELAKFKELEKEVDDRSIGKQFSRVSWPSWPSRAEAKVEPPPPPPPPAQQQSAPMSAPAPPPPPVVVPKPLPPPEHKVPDWKVIEEDMDGSVYHKRILRSTVEFSPDGKKVTMRQQYGNWFIYTGVRVGENQYKGTWKDEFPRDEYYYWGDFEIKFAPDLQSAHGWKTIRDDDYNKVKTTWEYIPRL